MVLRLMLVYESRRMESKISPILTLPYTILLLIV